MKKISIRFPIILCAAALVFCGSSMAQPAWDGGGDGNSFNDSLNWAGNTLPATGSVIQFTGATSGTFTNNFSPNINLAGALFDSTGAITINGSVSLNILTADNSDIRGSGSGNTIINTPISGIGTQVLSFNIATASLLTVAGVVSTSGNFVKNGNGTLRVEATNIYSGSTIVRAGTLLLGAANVLPDTAVVLGRALPTPLSGTLQTLGLADTTGTLQLLSASTIVNGAGLSFANSSGTFGTSVLTILNWTSGTIRFGTNNTGLTSGQLSNISAFYTGGASAGPLGLDANGFLVAVPEPGALLAGMLLLGGIGWRERRHFLRQRTVA